MIGLLIIDMQQAFDLPGWGERNNPQAEECAQELLLAFRSQGRPVLHVQHVSDQPESFFHTAEAQAFKTGFEPMGPESFFHTAEAQAFKTGFEPMGTEPVFQKRVNSAFIGTDLEQYLRQAGIDQLVIVGLTLPHCVSTTTRMAGNLGFQVSLVADATATFTLSDLKGHLLDPDLLHQVHLASLQGEFAQVLETKEVLEMLKI